MVARIIIVEDEPAIAESVCYALERDSFSVGVATSLSEAEGLIEDADLLILDLMLPDGSGFDLIRRLRSANRTTPVIVLSSRDSEADRVAALETGADDYVTKPFSPREVVARVRAVLRRVHSSEPKVSQSSLSAATLCVDDCTRRAHINGKGLELTRVEFDLLAQMLEAPGRVYTRSELIDRVWGDGFAISDRTVDSHIKALRRKVADAGGDPLIIETVRGVGYRLNESLPESQDP